MHKKSSAKLGDLTLTTDEERTGGGAKYGASVVRRWLERPAMHSPPAQNYGRPGVEPNADSVDNPSDADITPVDTETLKDSSGDAWRPDHPNKSHQSLPVQLGDL